MSRKFFGIVWTICVAGMAAWTEDISFSSEGRSASVFMKSASDFHSADQDKDGRISLTELLRVIQFFNLRGLHCQEGTEDGYAPGAGLSCDCHRHQSDYNPPDWQISLTELLRLIQLFNVSGYYACDESEDGFCARILPNIVLLLLDTLRADRIGSIRNEAPVMPFLSEFAQTGALFTHAIAPSSWTRPSMASYFTGMYSEHFLGAANTDFCSRYMIDHSWQTIGEWLTACGYDAWALLTNNNTAASLGFAQGFPAGHYEYPGVYKAEKVVNTALERMLKWREPFFSYIHFLDPHGPYAPPAEYASIFGATPVTTPNDEYWLSPYHYGEFVANLSVAWVNYAQPTMIPLSANGIIAMQYRYDAENRYLDDQLRRLVMAIQDSRPNTLFIILSDHGETLMSQNMNGHGYALYEHLIRVPLIICGPGVDPAVYDRPVETLGLLPSLAKLLHLPANPLWEGRDFFTETSNEPIFTHSWFFSGGVDTVSAAVTFGDMKLMLHNILGAPQLFNIADDPSELTDLSTEQPDTVAQLTDLLNQHLHAVMPF